LDVADKLCSLAAALGEPEVRVDGHMVGRWERGIRRPGPRYARLLCGLYDRLPEELDLVIDAPGEGREDPR